MKIQRRSVRLIGNGPRKSRIRIGQRVFIFFILAILVTAAIGLSLNLYFEEREEARGVLGEQGR
jgi:hypothetical protein